MAIIAPEVAPQPIQAPREQATASPETFGGGAGVEQMGAQVQKVAADAGDIATFEKIRADQTAVQTANAQLSQAANSLLWDPQTGVMSSRGANAMAAHDAGWEQYRKTANDISDTLTGEAQKGAFAKEALSTGDAFNRAAMAHVAGQLQKQDDDSFNAFVKNKTNLAAGLYGDPLTRQGALAAIDDHATEYARRNGLDPDQTQLLKMGITSNFHEQTIDQMVKDPRTAPMANQYYAENKDNIDLATRSRLEATLQEGDTRYGAQAAVQSILQNHPNSESESLKAADKIDDADQRDMARKMISTKFQQDRQALKNDQDDTFMKMGQMVDQKGLTDSADIRNAVPPDAWNQLREDQRTALLKRGSDPVTSINKWTDFQEAIKDGSISSMSQADLQTKYLPYFSASDAKTAADQWSKSQNAAGSAKLANVQSIPQLVDTTAVASGLVHADTKLRGESERQTIKLVQDNVNRDVIGFQEAQKRNPTPAEKQAMVDKHVIDAIGNKSGSIWSVFSSKPEVPFSVMPEEAKEDIINSAKQHGKTLSKADIEKAYPNWLKWKKTNG